MFNTIVVRLKKGCIFNIFLKQVEMIFMWITSPYSETNADAVTF